MTKDDELVLLAHAPNRAMADVWVSMLEARGIQAYAPGRYLADQWASWGQLIGGLGCDVQVPRSRLEEAKEIIAQIGEADDDDGELEDEGEPTDD